MNGYYYYYLFITFNRPKKLKKNVELKCIPNLIEFLHLNVK